MRAIAALLWVVVIALHTAGSAAAQSADAGAGQADARPSPVVSRAATDLEVRYVANEGFLIEGAGKRVLIDGLFGDGVTGYPVSPGEMRSQLEQGAGDWAGIRVALASHFHADHFHPGSVARFLEANPEALFVSTPQAVEQLAQALADEPELLERARGLLPNEGAVARLEIDGIEIELLNLHHGRMNPPVENLGVVVTLGGARFLHFGDTEAKIDDFAPYLERLGDVDLALLPFWFLSSEWRAEMVRDQIRPRSIVVAHMPLPSAPAGYFGRWRSYDGLVRTIRDGFPDARFPGEPGEPVQLGSD